MLRPTNQRVGPLPTRCKTPLTSMKGIAMVREEWWMEITVTCKYYDRYSASIQIFTIKGDCRRDDMKDNHPNF